MLSKAENRKILIRSLCIGMGLSVIMFGTNWLVLIHESDRPTSFQLFDISFYYFTPLLSWVIITIVVAYFADRLVHSNELLKSKLLWLVGFVLLLSPIVRMFDILVDFGLKNLFGMISVSPFKVLNDVWLVVLFSSPTAVLKMMLIVAVVYFFKSKKARRKTITMRSKDGGYHVLTKDSISYLKSDGNYINVRVDGADFRTRNTLKSIESELGSSFFRIHKSTIINWNYIRQLKHWRNGEYLIIMFDDKPLTSSKSYKSTIEEIKKLMISTPDVVDDPSKATVHPTIAQQPSISTLKKPSLNQKG